MAGDDGVLAGEQAAPGQLLVGQQRRGHHERLGHRGVGDLLGGRGGAQAGQVQAADLRPGSETLGGAGQLKPGGEHAGGLGALSGRKRVRARL